MKILVIDQYYPRFLKNFYSKNKLLFKKDYKTQKKALMNAMFGTADFYSHSLKKLGHVADEVVVNNKKLQLAWLRENTNIKLKWYENFFDYVISNTPFVSNRFQKIWEGVVLEQQVKKFKPDVLYVQNIGYINPHFLTKFKKEVKLVVGQVASPLPPFFYFKPYDLIISSMPHLVRKFRKMGVNSEYLKLAFDRRILRRLARKKRIYDVTFIGGISKAHKDGYQLLLSLAEQIKIDVWGYGKESLKKNSKLYKYHHGEAWGKDMYELMMQSKITINRHIDIADKYANNMRLYEATGCGAMLITEDKQNLKDIFNVNKEVVTYKDVDELVLKIKHYLKKDEERKKIAKAGEKKTLEKHNYLVRMKELEKILLKYL